MVLYKYRDFKEGYHLRLLYHQELYFSDLSKMNDPFEGILPIQDISKLSDDEILDANVMLQKQKNKNWSDETDKMFRNAIDTNAIKKRHQNAEGRKLMQARITQLLYNNFGIVCLSCDPLNYLMWSHYANSHSGFCIGFNVEKLLNSVKPCGVLPVNYTEEKPVFKIGDDPLKYSQKYLGTKGRNWEYEQEFRFVKLDVINNSIQFDIKVIDEIYLGHKTTKKNEQEVIKFYSKENPFCKIYKVKLSETRYELERIPV